METLNQLAILIIILMGLSAVRLITKKVKTDVEIKTDLLVIIIGLTFICIYLLIKHVT